MPAVVDCPSCTRKLRVPDELLGTRVKCPTCGEVFDAALPSSTSAASEGPPRQSEASPPLEQSPLPPPVPGLNIKLTLDEDFPPQKSSPQETPWRNDEDLPPSPSPSRRDGDLRPCPFCGEKIARKATRCTFCDEDMDREGDDRPWERKGRFGVRRDWEPHRGTLILVLGIISLVTVAIGLCWVAGLPLGIAAWVMGHRDMKKMKANLMDPEGKGLTQGGFICGIIGTILNALAGLLCLGYFGFIGFMVHNVNQNPPPRPRPVPPPPPPKMFEAPGGPLRVQDYLPHPPMIRARSVSEG